MAQQLHPDLKSLIIAFHGNNDFSSDKMQGMLGDAAVQHSEYRFHFRYTKDLNLFHQYADLDFDHSLTQAKLEESRFVILIGLEVIFSSSMLSLIYSIPGRYGLDRSRENIFWDRAVVVFDVGDHQDHDQVIQLAINNNSGIREVVERVGGRYTNVPQSTNREQFLPRFSEIIKETEIIPPQFKFPLRRNRNTLLPRSVIGSYVPTLATSYFRDLYERKPALPITIQNKSIETAPILPSLFSIFQAIALSHSAVVSIPLAASALQNSLLFIITNSSSFSMTMTPHFPQIAPIGI